MSKRRRPPSHPPATPDAPRLSPRGWAIGVALLLLAGAVVRVQAARGELWFDEVWSLYKFALAAASPADIFAENHDNNHHLVSLWMYLVGLPWQWTIYRIPSLLAGLGTILLAALWARRLGVIEGLLAAALTASSFVLITYASEARGYALAGFFALFGIWWVEPDKSPDSWRNCAIFWVSVALGLLSHLTYVFAYAGMLAASLVPRHTNRRVRPNFAALARWHAIPLVLVAGFYLLHARGMLVGGGPQFALRDVLAETLALVAGGASQEPALGLLAMLAAALGVGGLVVAWRTDTSLAVLMLVTIWAAPALALLVQQPTVLYPRYFYIPFLFLLLLTSLLLGWLSRRGLSGQLAAGAILVVVLVGNVRATAGLLRDGRGQYLAALQYLLDNTDEQTISLQSDHDFESRFMLTYYLRYLPENRDWIYVGREDTNTEPPRWTIVNSQADPFAPHPSIRDARGQAYRLVRVFPRSGLSGYHWAIYRREASSNPSPAAR